MMLGDNMQILAVIPARGGSKGIPRKNIRLLNGKPLISYAIQNALNSKFITHVFVSTDSEEIAEISRQYGARVIMRGEELSSDMVTLDPVIFDGMLKAESTEKTAFDYVITMQPTSPLLSVETLDKGIAYCIEGGYDTVISSVNKPHLSWGINEGHVFPMYKERKNRQELPAQFFETGAFVIAKRNAVTRNSRIGQNVSVFEMPESESIDIDSKEDWVLAESILRRKKIILRADGHKRLGMGHIYNCITMAYNLIAHDIVIVTKMDADIGLRKIKETNLPYHVIKDDEDLFNFIGEFKPDIFVNDCLNSNRDYIVKLKSKVDRVVSIEDLGTGAEEADAVINALYDDEKSASNTYSGYKYVCLRDEFLLSAPNKWSSDVRNVLIMFGGTDPANLNKMLYKIVEKISDKYGGINFSFITGIGYDNEGNGVISQPEKNIYVYPNVPNVTKFMKDADLAITSQGRTIFELAAMGIPAIVLSQNKRENTHKFAQMENGFLNLGMGSIVDERVVENTVDWLINTPEIRRNMYDLMTSLDLRSGVKRVVKIILGDQDE